MDVMILPYPLTHGKKIKLTIIPRKDEEVFYEGFLYKVVTVIHNVDKKVIKILLSKPI